MKPPEPAPVKKQLAPGYQPGEPTIKFEEVKKHNSPEKGIWVTYRDGVYDITKFVQNHPGGLERILKAAGGQIDPFWAMYAQHNVASVKDILGEHRIGHLSIWTAYRWVHYSAILAGLSKLIFEVVSL